MATSEPKPTKTTKSTDDDSEHESGEDTNTLMKPVPVMTVAERQHFQDLGLGRGVDSSDPQLWKNKSPVQTRTITADLENIIATDESEVEDKYKKIVSSLKTQQSKIQSSLSDPTSLIKIGLDAHYSQSSSSTVTIQGTKVKTRTISFRHDLDDLEASPADSESSDHEFGQTSLMPHDHYKENSYSMFENKLASWILRKLQDEQKNGKISSKPEIHKLKGKTSMQRLVTYSEGIPAGAALFTSERGYAIEQACETFTFEFGITHYVSTIELGALRYSIGTSQSRSSNTGLGGSVGAGSTASGSISTDISHLFKATTKKEHKIGDFNEKGEVKRDTSGEAVIGFHLQPVSKLIRVPNVQLALEAALAVYLKSKTDDTVGPFLLSTDINEKPVYWKVNQEQLSLIGTEDIKAASLFYIMSAGDQFSPANFTIAYWGDQENDRKMLTNMNNPLTQLHTAAPKLPAFLTTNTSLFHLFDVPLLFKYTFSMKTAQYTLHSRIYRSFACFTCVAGSVSIQTFLEGDEFYIKHSPHALKSVYLAIKQETGAAQTPLYTSTVFPSIKYADKEGIGMVFRLHPYQFRDNAGKSSSLRKISPIQ